MNEFIRTRDSCLVTTDVNLNTARVELGTSKVICQMEGDDLVTEEVSAGSEGGRKRKRMGLSVNCKGFISVVDQEGVSRARTYIDLVGPIHRRVDRLDRS